MMVFENFLRQIESINESDAHKVIEILYTFCSEALITEKDFLVFECCVSGKKQREVSVLLNMHRPLITYSLSKTKKILRTTYLFLFNDLANEGLLVAKKILSPNEYRILNYRLVGYSFKQIGEELGFSTQYVGKTAGKTIIKKFRENSKNKGIAHLLGFMRKALFYWSTS